MDDLILKKKIIQWLELKEESKRLQKAAQAPAPKSTAHVWDKNQEPKLTATGFLPKYKPQPQVKLPIKKTVSPALVSAPTIENRVDRNTPKQINQPNIINPYKEIFSSLQKRKK
jgi:hypothetical protein